ncbi:MAG: hypothetical protein KF801_04425 [Cryobacterium sp.]|nr:hypothetical protein [Cryobacterium sp.]
MAETSGIDAAIRSAFANAARPADSHGVADAIRSRMSAGDTGTPADGPTAPGFGGRWFSWLPWVGVVLVTGIAGGALGLTGMFGHAVDDVAVVGHTTVLNGRASLSSCPGGPVIGTIGSGTRVLVVERFDSGSVGIRNPADFSSVAWLEPGDVTIDADQPSIADLPLGASCPIAIVATPKPSNSAKPTKPTPPPVAKDTTAPVLGKPKATPSIVYVTTPSVITVTASDNVGVVSVKITWTGEYSGSGYMTKIGGVWKYTFTPPSNDSGFITFSLRATDAAGNHSQKKTVILDHRYFG